MVIAVPDSKSDSQGNQEQKSGFVASCFEWVEALITALIAVMIFFVFLFRLNVMVNGDSMKPNYQDGYRVFVSCMDRNFKDGDVIAVDEGGTKLHKRLIKRIIATGGQTVNIDFKAGVVYINGKALDESRYIQNGITKDQYDVQFPQTVPAGHVFVLGDNRTISEDSRFSDVGMIDCRYIIGKIPFLLSPFSGFNAK